MSPRKRVISIFLILVLLVTAPFSIVHANEGPYTTFTINNYAAYQFFNQYGFQAINTQYGAADQYPIDDVLDCVTTGDTTACTLYDYQVRAINNIYFPMVQGRTNNDGSYLSKITTPKSYSSTNRIRVTTEPIYIFFFSTFNTTTENLNIYPANNNYTVHATRVTTDSQSLVAGTYYLVCLKVWADSVPTEGTTKGYVFASIDLGFNNNTLNNGSYIITALPIYYGSKYTMPEDVYYYIFNEPKPNLSYDATTYELLEEGTQESKDSVELLDDVTGDLSDDFSQLSTIESGYNTDFNNQIQAINFNDQLSGQQGFLTSSSFVINVFNQLILNNPLTILIIIVSIFYVFRRFV